MGLLYFHLRDHVDELIDPDGIELANLDHAKAKALAAARDVMAGDLARGIIDLRYRIDVEDADAKLVYSLPFKHAVTIIPDTSLQANDA